MGGGGAFFSVGDDVSNEPRVSTRVACRLFVLFCFFWAFFSKRVSRSSSRSDVQAVSNDLMDPSVNGGPVFSERVMPRFNF